MAGVAHHYFFRYCTPPMNPALMVSGTDVSFGNDDACVTHLKHDHGMGVIVDTQNISGFYVCKCKITLCIHPGRQTAECRVAEYKSKGYAAHGADLLPVKRSALPMISSLCVRIRLIIGPDRPFLILIIFL